MRRICQSMLGWDARWLLGLAVFLIYGRSLALGFMADDYDILTAVSQPHFDPWMAFPAGTGTYFRPLILWLFYLEYQLAGTTAVWYHLTNLLLHLGNGLLVFALCRHILPQRQLALLLALFFVAHPLGLTAVTNINARIDSVMTLFYLTSLWSFIRFTDTGQRRWLIVAGLGLVGSLLSKEMGLTLVGILWLWWLWGPVSAKKWWGTAALFVYLLITALFVGYVYGRFYQSPTATPSFNPDYALSAVVAFPLLLILPNRQALLLQIYEAHPWLLWSGGAALGLLLAALLIWAWRRNDGRDLLLAGGWIMISLLPLALSGINSRRVYLPLAIFCLGLAVVLARRPLRRQQRFWVLVGIMVIFASISFAQGQAWLDNWQTLQRACHSLPSLTPDTELIFLTVPYTANEVPVFSNDLNKALYFCQRQQFGAFARVGTTGNLILENGRFVAGMVTLTRPQPDAFNFAVHSPDLYFDFPRRTKVGQVYASDVVRIRVTAVRADGRATGFTAAFTQPEKLANSKLLYFTGSEFQSISLQQ